MPATVKPYYRNIKKFEKDVYRQKWREKHAKKWWMRLLGGTKRHPVIISEGDSWFDFPVKSLTDVPGVGLKYLTGLQNFGMDSNTNVIDWLSRDNSVKAMFLRIERSGDHAEELTAKQPDRCGGVWEKKVPSQTLFTALKNKTVRKHLDAIVLSAGGNDMVKVARHGSLQAYCGSWIDSYDHACLEAGAKDVVQHYLQAILYRDHFAPQAKILCHSYAYANQVSNGMKFEFEFSDVAWLVKVLLKFTKLEMIQKSLTAIGINIDDLGNYTHQKDANLHETMDELGWPKNPDPHDHEQGEGFVHPERAAFIKAMIDALYKEMTSLPALYKGTTGKELGDYHYLDIRQSVQAPEYWSDFIHLNNEGYKLVSQQFAKALKALNV